MRLASTIGYNRGGAHNEFQLYIKNVPVDLNGTLIGLNYIISIHTFVFVLFAQLSIAENGLLHIFS